MVKIWLYDIYDKPQLCYVDYGTHLEKPYVGLLLEEGRFALDLPMTIESAKSLVKALQESVEKAEEVKE